MKMKFKIKLLLVVSVFLGYSCNFLDEKNLSSLTADELYTTGDGYEQLINGCYSNLRSIYNSRDFLKMGWEGTDVFTQNDPSATRDLNQYPVTYNSNNSSIYKVWEELYKSLKNANAAIVRAEYTDLDESTKLQRVAEAKALRALYLFHIVRNWGDAPLMLDEPSAPITTGTRDSASDIYKQILQDLDVAINTLPSRQTGENYGRFSSSAAKHLRALVYLTRGYETYAESDDYLNAYNDAVDVMYNSGHSMLGDFADVHRQSNEMNDEVIFSVQYGTDQISGIGNKMPMYFLFPYREGYPGLAKDTYYGNDDGFVMPTKFAYSLFDWDNDRRAEVTFMSPFNGDMNTSIEGKDAGKNWFQCVQEVSGVFSLGDTAIYFPVPADENYKAWSTSEKDAKKYLVYNYPTGDITDWSNDDYYNDMSSGLKSRTWLPIWKFKDANTLYYENGDGTGTRDIYVFRLAETALIASEAALQLGDNPNALKYLNKVRERAEKVAGSLAYPSGTEVTIDMILDERETELLGEVSHWNDLQRTRTLIDRVRAYNWDVTNIVGGIQTQLTPGATKFYLRPIPLTWLNSLTNQSELSNNTGW